MISMHPTGREAKAVLRSELDALSARIARQIEDAQYAAQNFLARDRGVLVKWIGPFSAEVSLSRDVPFGQVMEVRP